MLMYAKKFLARDVQVDVTYSVSFEYIVGRKFSVTSRDTRGDVLGEFDLGAREFLF